MQHVAGEVLVRENSCVRSLVRPQEAPRRLICYQTFDGGVGLEHLHDVTSSFGPECVGVQLEVGDDAVVLRGRRKQSSTRTGAKPEGTARHATVNSAYSQGDGQSFGTQRSQTVVVQVHMGALQAAKEGLDGDGLGVVAGLQVELRPRQVRLIAVWRYIQSRAGVQWMRWRT